MTDIVLLNDFLAFYAILCLTYYVRHRYYGRHITDTDTYTGI
ncbi:MAG: hypothetical protein SPH68_01415 [Candidatus Borkfalkiaceae bacterium]|nr:hypothetical protein [Clostridia bacterium]MDY6222803.1 hypothetical protein [Christensenellaceae bacterium]